MFLNIFFDFNQGTPIKLTYKNNGILTIINKKNQDQRTTLYPKKQKKRVLVSFESRTLAEIKKAATYSPALHCSTIGDGGLNFSVRNGKRWDPAAITT